MEKSGSTCPGIDISSLPDTLNTHGLHDSGLFSIDCNTQFVALRDNDVAGSAAILSATLDEVRIWSVEGQRIGQFGRDRWDLSVGIRHSFDELDEEGEASPLDDDEEGRCCPIALGLLSRPARLCICVTGCMCTHDRHGAE